MEDYELVVNRWEFSKKIFFSKKGIDKKGNV
jgi:hypothetical protein